MKTPFLKNNTLLLMVACFFTLSANAQTKEETLMQDKQVKLDPKQEAAYKEFVELKSKLRFSFHLTPEEYKMMKEGDAEGLKKSLGDISGTMANLLTTPISVELQPNYTISTCDPPTIQERAIVTETFADGTSISYELKGFEKCPSIYASIPNVDCTDLP